MSTMPERLRVTRDRHSMDIDGPLRELAMLDACEFDVADYVLATRLAEVEAQLKAERGMARELADECRKQSEVCRRSGPHEVYFGGINRILASGPPPAEKEGKP